MEKQITVVEHCSKTAVNNLLTKFQNSGCDSDSKRSGRPQKTTVRDDGGGGGTTRPLPRDGGAEELRGDPTVGPHPKVWTIDRE